MTVLFLSVNMSESIIWNNALTTVYTDSYVKLAMRHVSYSADVQHWAKGLMIHRCRLWVIGVLPHN